ncbi:MAG: sugar phosphate isomerase/epimerase family protein [Ignisphaera sp.]
MCTIVKLDILNRLDEFKGFLEGETVDRFLETFDIRFGSGTWAAGGFSDRFMVRGYFPDLGSDIISRLERIRIAGIKMFVPINVELLNENLEVRWETVDAVVEYTKKYNMMAVALAVDLSGIPKFRLGSITNPDPLLRKKSISILLNSIEIAKKLGTDVISFWPGQDGWDYSFEINYGKMLKMFIDNLKLVVEEAMAKGFRFCIEAKLKEPKEGNIIIPTTHVAIAIAKKINDELGKSVVGITIDYGHELMYAVEPAYTVYLAKLFDVPLLSIHINTAKTHSNDEDRVVGTGDLWQFVDFLYATIDTGFDGPYILDQFTYRMDPVDGLRLSKEFFANSMKKALEIYRHRDVLEKTRDTGDQVKVLDLIKKIIYTY